MRRKRFMKGSLRQRKHGRNRLWLAQWWEDGSRRTKVLGKCTEFTKGQAEAMQDPLDRTFPVLLVVAHLEQLARERQSVLRQIDGLAQRRPELQHASWDIGSASPR